MPDVPDQPVSRSVEDGMDGIETQPVEPILLEPVERIVDIEFAHDWLAEVERLAPWGIEFIGEEFRRCS